MAVLFTRRADRWLRGVALGTVLTGVLSIAGLYYYAPPEYTRVGYAPRQPVAFSHAQHAGKLGMSCVYCHTHVESSPHANIPDAQTCMACHQVIKANSPLLEEVRSSWLKGDPVRWRRVHKLPDYVYFNHAAHVRRGVGCVSCHGHLDEMPVVVHDQPLSMGWCLDCHRHPETALRPLDEVTNLNWSPNDPETWRGSGLGREETGLTQIELGARLKARRGIRASEQCSACHR